MTRRDSKIRITADIDGFVRLYNEAGCYVMTPYEAMQLSDILKQAANLILKKKIPKDGGIE